MARETFCFADIQMTLRFPSVQPFIVDGRGAGEITLSWTDDNTVHDVAADGHVMPTKRVSNAGSFSISVQQTSHYHQLLHHIFSTVYGGSTQLWTAGNLNISAPIGGGEIFVASGVSFRKRADQPYGVNGAQVSWPFMACDLQHQSLLASVQAPAITDVTGQIVS